MRRLTISFHVTVANYEYLVYWRLYQDGNIECEVRATGIMVTTPLAPGQPHPNGTLVDERTYAPFHQHFLVARPDMDIDGSDNTVYMTETYPEPVGPDNPHGLSLVVRNVPLRTESQAKQDVNFATQRSWKVVNTNVVNGIGTHHITRPEDWPVMPVDVVSFWLKPFGFFDRNPSLDVVATPPDMCHRPSISAHH